MFEQSSDGFYDGFADGTFVQYEYFVGIDAQFDIVCDAGVVAEVFFVGLHDLQEWVAGVLYGGIFLLFLQGCEGEVAGDIIADDEVVIAEFEPFAFHSFVLEYDVEAFFEFADVFCAVLADDAEYDGQVGVIGGQAFLQVLRSADLVQILTCSQYINTFTILYLFHVSTLVWMHMMTGGITGV